MLLCLSYFDFSFEESAHGNLLLLRAARCSTINSERMGQKCLAPVLDWYMQIIYFPLKDFTNKVTHVILNVLYVYYMMQPESKKVIL